LQIHSLRIRYPLARALTCIDVVGGRVVVAASVGRASLRSCSTRCLPSWAPSKNRPGPGKGIAAHRPLSSRTRIAAMVKRFQNPQHLRDLELLILLQRLEWAIEQCAGRQGVQVIKGGSDEVFRQCDQPSNHGRPPPRRALVQSSGQGQD
jgi:hypothetical protein